LRYVAGLQGTIRRGADGSTELVVTPRLAGKTEELVAIFEEADVLGLFAYRKELDLGMVVESLPTALQTPAEPPRIHPISIGENPAGVMGSGQELFAVAEYQAGMETRDIMWKRAARMSDDRIPMRVREANVKKVVKIGLAVGWSAGDRATRVDMIAEALAQVCKGMLLIGTTVEIDYSTDGRVHSLPVSNLGELADALVGSWTVSANLGDPIVFGGVVDLLIMGPDDPEAVSRQAHLHPGRLLVLSDPISNLRLPRGALAFTGEEDLGNLVTEVLAR
jgi:hypothetical protein